MYLRNYRNQKVLIDTGCHKVRRQYQHFRQKWNFIFSGSTFIVKNSKNYKLQPSAGKRREELSYPGNAGFSS